MAASKKRILVVEDDPAIRAMEERILGASGFEVRTASNGLEGLDRAREGAFDLFLLDVMMPGMSGMELARELQREPATRSTPILFATAHGQAEAMTEAFSAGASLYLVKPFTTTTLLAMVRAAMSTL